MRKLKTFFKRFYLGILLLFLYMPILMLTVYSFNEGKTMAKWSGFSLKWYQQLFADRSRTKRYSHYAAFAVRRTACDVKECE